MVSEDLLERWLRLELGSVHDGLVTRPQPLETLLRMDDPVAQTRSGDPHEFDRDALDRFADGLSEEVRARVKLPVSIHADRKAAGNVFVEDDAAIDALTELGEARTEPRDGKLWMGKPLALDLARRYPTLFQLVLR